MLFNTQGILIRTTAFSESSLIAKVYTRKWGMQSFMLRGVKSKRSSIKTAFLQPLSFLDMVVQHRGNRELQQMREAKPAIILTSIPYEVQKSGIAIFATELIYKTVKEEEPNESLFSFLHSFIAYLDTVSEGVGNVPIFFMIEMSRFLGFFPQIDGGTDAVYFHLDQGSFSTNQGTGELVVSPPASQYLRQLLEIELDELAQFLIPSALRHQLMLKMIHYYRLHIDNFPGLKSYEVLREVLRK